MLLALFLLETAAGLYLFLPLVGRRNAGVKFYRLILVTSVSLTLGAAMSHQMAGRKSLAINDLVVVALLALVYFVLRYPKRLVFRATAFAAGLAYVAAVILAFHETINPRSLVWSVAGSLTSTGLLGSVSLAMLLGHWYLVVRGMAIDPLERLVKGLLFCSIAKTIAVAVVLVAMGSAGFETGTPLYRVVVTDGIFFWMRVGWGLFGPLALYPMIHGTVKLHSTMAATGILYVAVVAVVIGEVLGLYLSALMHLPL